MAEIAAIPDVDLLFVGPADISQVLGVPGDFENPKCLDAIERIARACADAGKPWGIVPRGPEYAERMRGWGCRMFVLGFDIHAFHAGIRAVKDRYAAVLQGVMAWEHFIARSRHRKPGRSSAWCPRNQSLPGAEYRPRPPRGHWSITGIESDTHTRLFRFQPNAANRLQETAAGMAEACGWSTHSIFDSLFLLARLALAPRASRLNCRFFLTWSARGSGRVPRARSRSLIAIAWAWAPV